MNKMTVEFLQRVNDGNYEHREIKVSTVIDGDSEVVLGAQAHAITKFAKDVLDGKFASTTTSTEAKGASTVKKVEPALKTGKGTTVPKEDIVNAGPVTVKNSFTEEDAEASTPEIEKSEPKPQEADAVATLVKEKAKRETKKKPATETTVVTKGKAGKEEPYDRENDSHKNQMSTWLDEVAPGWDEEDTIKIYGAASRKLVGTPFRDKDGEIVESFKAALLSLVSEVEA